MLFYLTNIVLKILLVASDQMESKVVRGEMTSIERHPYSAFISIANRLESDIISAYICGASIINQKLLLTAAHCFDGLTADSKGTAHTGDSDKRKGFVTKIKTVKVHPNYDIVRIANDIALAGLEKELVFSNIIKRVALSHTTPTKGIALLAGWGSTDERPTESRTNILHETKQIIWTRRDCLKLMKKIPEGTFCCGKTSGGGYPSLGDSGSPLVSNGYIQIGLVSFKKIDISTSVIIYTSIAHFRDWIYDMAESVFCG